MDSFGDGFSDRYVWSGTRDRSPFIAMGDAMDFRENLGEAALVAYINKLSHDGAALIVKLWGTAGRGIDGLVAPTAMQVSGRTSNQQQSLAPVHDPSSPYRGCSYRAVSERWIVTAGDDAQCDRPDHRKRDESGGAVQQNQRAVTDRV